MKEPPLPGAAPPSISIVTPSFNQATFLESAIRPVLDQNYPTLEYVGMNGWTHAPDAGYYDAVAKGFARTHGEILGWLNSDDAHTPWALSIVVENFRRFPEIEWPTTSRPLFWDVQGRAVRCEAHAGYSRAAFFHGEYLPAPAASISATSTMNPPFGSAACGTAPAASSRTFRSRAISFCGRAFFSTRNRSASRRRWPGFRVHEEGQKTGGRTRTIFHDE